MRLSHNLASLNIYNEQTKVLQRQGSALERISSGYRVSKAKDDPYAISQSERLRMQIRGTQMASQNVQDGASMLQTAEGAIGSINENLQRIKELTVQAGGPGSPEDKKIIQTEINNMLSGINDIASSMSFNGVKLISQNGSLTMPVGANVNENVQINMYDLKASSLKDASGNTLDSIDVTTDVGVQQALKTVNDINNKVLSINSEYGAIESRFDSTFSNLNEIGDKMQGAESVIRDSDVAEEMLEYSKDSILVEAGNAMMAQTNKFPQDILRILENVRK